jgi:uncharacterized protein YidB (DUF937 family)
MSGLFGSKKSSAESPNLQTFYDPFKSTREAVNSWLTEQTGKTGPTYEGERVAPMTELEQASQDWGKTYAEQPATGESLALAQDEIKKTLSGDYDPSTSPYYQAVKAEAERNLDKTNKTIAGNSTMGRRYFSGARVKAQADAATDTNIALNKEMGAMAERERQNRLAAVPQAAALDEQETNAAAKKAMNLQTIGALPRELQQALMDAAYQEWMAANYDYPLNIAQIGSGLAAREPTWVQQGYNTGSNSVSGISKILSMVGNIF